MKYLALLRGINIGKKTSVSMAKLKQILEDAHLQSVITYINSGNFIFESKETDKKKLTKKIEDLLKINFFPIKTLVLSHRDLKAVMNSIPNQWEDNNLRKYVAFVIDPLNPQDIIKAANPIKDVDTIEKGPGVVYMSTKLDGITKSGYSKLSTTSIYQHITIRNQNTVQKLFALMEKDTQS